MRRKLHALLALLASALLHACASAPPGAGDPAMQESVRVQPAAGEASEPAPAPPPRPPRAIEGPATLATPLDAAKQPPFSGEKEVIEPRTPIRTVDATQPREDLWQRIRKGFSIPDLDNAFVRKQLAHHKARPTHLQTVFDRSRRYLYHIVSEIERRGMPTELALLPMVESAFNPMAYSRAHASGLWQFIPGTGKRFELAQTWWYDERRDIVDSTNAALDYLTELYRMHGDWHLALASYNWGEHAVARAVERNRKAGKRTDYTNLRMPKETRWYVPKLQALENIIRDPERYGVDLDPIPDEPYFVQLSETPDMDLQLAARLADMPVEEFLALNPGFKRPIIRASEATRLVLPAEKVHVFYDNLAKHNADSLVSWRVYHPRRGETFGSIAKKFGLPIAELKKVNGVPARSWKVPDVMVVPTHEAARSAAKLPVMYAPPIPVRGSVGIVHRVRAGDTLSSIAERYRVSVADLRRWNRVAAGLQIGQKIYIKKELR